MTRCRPGDLAITIASDYGNVGKLVEVLYAVSGMWIAPDCTSIFIGCDDDIHWAVLSLGSPFSAGDGMLSMYAVFPDRKLRPLPGPHADMPQAEVVDAGEHA